MKEKTNLLYCDVCGKHIGFKGKGHWKHYDDGVWNIGNKYVCSDKCKNNLESIEY